MWFWQLYLAFGDYSRVTRFADGRSTCRKNGENFGSTWLKGLELVAICKLIQINLLSQLK